MKLAPKTATVVRDGQEQEIGIDYVRTGDIFVVRPGENIPVDGVIIDGFRILRSGREPVEYRGPVRDLKILRDGRVAEVFVNGGEEVYTALL